MILTQTSGSLKSSLHLFSFAPMLCRGRASRGSERPRSSTERVLGLFGSN